MVWQAFIGILKSIAINLAISLAIAAIRGRGQQEGPRLEDLSVQTSTYGRFLPIIYGTPPKISGNVIWLENGEILETRHEETVGDIFGIGGTDIVTYTYSATFAVAICDGPVRVRRMWANSTLVYDEALVTETQIKLEFKTIHHAAIYYANPDAYESYGFKFAEQIENAIGDIDDLRVYKGTEDQNPDYKILAEDPDAPAYRNTAYVVFDNLQLEKYGNQIPQIYFEVVQDDDEGLPDRLTSNGASVIESPMDDPFEVDTEYHYPISFNGGVLRIQLSHRVTTAGNITLLNAAGEYIGQEYNSGILPDVPGDGLGFVGPGRIKGTYPSGHATKFGYPAELVWASLLESQPIQFDVLSALNLQIQLIGLVFSADNQHMLLIDGDHAASYNSTQTPTAWYIVRVDGFNDATIVNSGTWAEGLTIGPTGTVGFSKGGDSGAGSFDFTSGCLEDNLRYFWGVYSAGNGNVNLYWIDEKNVCNEITPPNGQWTESLGGGTGGVANLIAGDNPWCFANAGKMMCGNGAWTGVFSRRPQVARDATTDGAILTDLATRAGLSASDIDVSNRTDEIRGYAISNLASLGSAIEPMQSVTYFDVVESDMKLKFPSRGGSSVVTLTADDLAAYEYGAERPQELIQKRGQETSIPKEIAVAYPDPSRNYDISEQYASRTTKNTERVNKLEFPIPMTADKAAQIADVTLYNLWAERNVYEFSLPYKFAYLDAGDLVTISLEQDHTVRLTEVQLGTSLVKCKGVAERADLYNSVAVGQEGQPALTQGFAGETHMEFLDIPIFRGSEATDSGFYIACGGYYPGWNGCQVWKASGSDQPYEKMAIVTTETTMGYCTTVLADANNTTVTDDTTVTVKPFNSKTLSATSDFTGNDNIAAIGDHGRWEIIRWTTATDNLDGTYTLSGLLRGYRGTEHNTGLHDDLDKFVLLSGSSLVRVAGVDADIDVERYYKAQTFGTPLSATPAKAFTNTAVGLHPLAPANIQGTRNGSDDLTITWTRRSRTGWYWLNGEECPLDQDNENYDIDIINTASPGVVLRTITATSETCSYTAAEQTTDFGSTQSAIAVRIYQISDNTTIDRGILGEAII